MHDLAHSWLGRRFMGSERKQVDLVQICSKTGTAYVQSSKKNTRAVPVSGRTRDAIHVACEVSLFFFFLVVCTVPVF